MILLQIVRQLPTRHERFVYVSDLLKLKTTKEVKKEEDDDTKLVRSLLNNYDFNTGVKSVKTMQIPDFLEHCNKHVSIINSFP